MSALCCLTLPCHLVTLLSRGVELGRDLTALPPRRLELGRDLTASRVCLLALVAHLAQHAGDRVQASRSLRLVSLQAIELTS